MILPHLIQLGVGRVLLSLTPPGRLGGHRPIELPGTLGASYLLGELVFSVQGQFLASWGRAEFGWQLAPWVVLLLLRLATLPAYYVAGAEPRHEERDGGFWALVAIGIGLGLWLRPEPRLVSFVFVVSHLLWQARRKPIGRAALMVVCLGVSTWLTGLEGVDVAGIFTALGAGFLIPWVRRNDLRGGMLAGLFFLAAGVARGHWLTTLLGALALAGVSYGPQWRYLAKVLTLTTVIAVACMLAGSSDTSSSTLAWLQGHYLVGLVAVLSAGRWARAKNWSVGEIEEPLREGVGIAGLLCALALVGSGSLWPLVVVWVGVSFLPRERLAP